MSATLLALQNVFREVFDNPTLRIAPHTSRSDLPDWDSVAQIKLILAVEEQFDFHFSEIEAPAMSNVGHFLAAIEKHRG